MLDSNARIFVAGHRGLIGSAVVRRLSGMSIENILLRDRASLELTDSAAVDRFFEENRPSYVVLAAGRVGGIVENQSYPADFMFINLAIQINILRAASHYGVRRLILFGSSCMYPRECRQPMSEDLLFTGKPEPTSMAYAVSKMAGVQTCLAYNQQFNVKRFIPVIPNSTYGPNDNFDPKTGHVLSALIHRFHQARQSGAKTVTLWGTGKPRREFIHADDIADACVWLLSRDISSLELPVNIGVGVDYSIQELAEKIAKVIGYTGTIEWDSSKPDGAPRKLLDSSRIQSLGWKSSVNFVDGLNRTYAWYLENMANEHFGTQ